MFEAVLQLGDEGFEGKGEEGEGVGGAGGVEEFVGEGEVVFEEGTGEVDYFDAGGLEVVDGGGEHAADGG